MDGYYSQVLVLLLSLAIFIEEGQNGVIAKTIVETVITPLNKIPTRARKAGGSLKTNNAVPVVEVEVEQVSEHHLDFPSSFSKIESSSSNNTNSISSNKLEEKDIGYFPGVTAEDHNDVSNINKESDVDSEESYSDENYSDEDDEEDCPRGKFWHIRGLRCVPFSCPGGNSLRNKNTGECLSNNNENSSNRDKGHICSYCIENNIIPYGACCHKLMSQPHLADGRNMRFQIVVRNTYKQPAPKKFSRG